MTVRFIDHNATTNRPPRRHQGFNLFSQSFETKVKRGVFSNYFSVSCSAQRGAVCFIFIKNH